MATIGNRGWIGYPLLPERPKAPVTIRPAFDMRLVEGGYYLDGNLPGLKRDHVWVHIEGQHLVISGKIKREYPAPPPDFEPDLRVDGGNVSDSILLEESLDSMSFHQIDAQLAGYERSRVAGAGQGAPAGEQGNEDGGAAPIPTAQADRGGQDAPEGPPAGDVWIDLGRSGSQRRADPQGDRVQRDEPALRGESAQRGDRIQRGQPSQRGEETQQGERSQRGDGNMRGRGRGEEIQRRGTNPRREGSQRRVTEGGGEDGIRHARTQWKLAEREVGRFLRVFEFDKPVEQEADVHFHDGILTIWVPLAPIFEPIGTAVSRD
ncbi:uncharacterized protein BO80DRAFT_14138 [Aspergillus ibericus CBS 121593]|uniref:SHSP domain-containing protein n=1 Tax=Aspergillus ibericus CBS 121593 TaxID=1448316 RepID=A0A395H6H5_9EURO|nr:hypothetical protein BO80DRAFT_14138 [Aspergillus ibericus CBS 121593]RAL03133.1 hypothetical protein BO80DRAFT_14138 [Aspergillus ibericus CBS 121593]